MSRPQTVAKLLPIDNQNAGKTFTCLHICPELTSVCPVTRQPDFATLRIEYEPGKHLVELKSLRDYLVGFRNAETFHEELLNRIYDDFVTTVSPNWVLMTLDVAVRGGIESKITRSSGPRKEHEEPLLVTRS